jgi:hypothetical protein
MSCRCPISVSDRQPFTRSNGDISWTGGAIWPISLYLMECLL